MKKLLFNFPQGFTPNKVQTEILSKTEKFIQEDNKFIIINAATGAGKSFLGKTFANSLPECSNTYKTAVDNYSIFGESGPEIVENEGRFGVYALTITKTLQDQYKETFNDTGVLKGQGNYQCQVDDEETVDTAPCLFVKGQKQECWACNRCTYYNARNEMLKSQFSALNYSMFFSLPEHLKHRKVIVCDEASELEEQLVSQFTCLIDIPFLVKLNLDISPFPTQETSSKVLEWLIKLQSTVSKKIEYYVEYFKNSSKKDADYQKKMGEYTKLSTFSKNLETLISTFNDSQYIIEHVEKNIKFIPLKVDKLSKYIFDYADHVILLSATIIDHKNFCKTLGITNYKYIETPSEFDSKKAPIYILAKQKINYSNLKSMLPTLCKQVKGLLEKHSDEKGIIHTHTQYIADYLRENLNDDRLLCRETGVRNEDLLAIHNETDEPTVLVSPSMTYGVDLKGDLAKFQILLKAPWLPTKDVRVEKLMKIDKDWYSNKMLCTVVQASGRGVRSASDECVTYMLDGSIYDSISRNKNKLPSFFLDRIQ